MDRINQAEFTNRLALHKMWLVNGSGGRRMEIENTVIEGARNPGADLRLATFKSVVFLNCDLPNSVFGDATIEKSVFDGSNMRESNFTGAKIKSSRMKQSNTEGTNFYLAIGATMLGKKSIDIDQFTVMSPAQSPVLDCGFGYDRGGWAASPVALKPSLKGYSL